MKLKSVEIQNFRSIRQQEIMFEPSCRVLVGINEAGKSNILRALALLDPERKPSRAQDVREALRNEPHVTQAHVRFYLSLEEYELATLYDEVSPQILSSETDILIASNSGKDLTLRQLLKARNDVRYFVDLIGETKEFRMALFPESYSLKGEWKKPTKACPDDLTIEINGKKSPLKSIAMLNGKDSGSIESQYLQEATIRDLIDTIKVPMTTIAKLSCLKAIFWEYDEKNLLPGELSVDEFAANPGMCKPLENMFRLAGVENISTEIQKVKALSANQQQNFYDRIGTCATQHFQSVWKEYPQIEIQLKLNANKLIPAIKEENSYNFSQRSDGFKRFVSFLLMISVNVKSETLTDILLLIDEADAGLHPTGARYLCDELIKIAQKNYVVYSTHSIFMIDTGNLSRHYIVKKSGEVTTAVKADQSNVFEEEVIYNALGFSMFSLLREKNIVFEGWRDLRLYEAGLSKASAPTKKALRDVGTCHAGGVGHVKSIASMLQLGKRGCLIISDADIAAKAQKKSFVDAGGHGEWNIYSDALPSCTAITGEDFLRDSYLIGTVASVAANRTLPAFSGQGLPIAGKLCHIEGWVRQQGLTQEETKNTMADIKSALFTDLDPKDVDASYFELLDSIAAKLSA